MPRSTFLPIYATQITVKHINHSVLRTLHNGCHKGTCHDQLIFACKYTHHCVPCGCWPHGIAANISPMRSSQLKSGSSSCNQKAKGCHTEAWLAKHFGSMCPIAAANMGKLGADLTHEQCHRGHKLLRSTAVCCMTAWLCGSIAPVILG